MRIEIRIKGQIDKHWSPWFEDLELSHDSKRDETVLRGKILDQAALYGLLAKLRDLGLGLLSVTVADASGSDGSAVANGDIDADRDDGAVLGVETLDT